MNQINKIQLQHKSISNVPVQTYPNDFSFFVNGKEFKTSRLVSDLLSPNICQIHQNDPTYNQITIETSNKGDFSHFLSLANFDEKEISDEELPFFTEIISQLGNDYMQIDTKYKTSKITEDNVLSLLFQHEKSPCFFREQIESEIAFISSHMSDLIDKQESELAKLSAGTLVRVIGSDRLVLKNEDQLLNLINGLCLSSPAKYSALYEFVIFKNATPEAMCEFLAVFDAARMTRGTWRRLEERLRLDAKRGTGSSARYTELGLRFASGGGFPGIIAFLAARAGGGLERELGVSSSSVYCNREKFGPRNAALHGDSAKYFESGNIENSWICFDFGDRRVALDAYAIRTINISKDNHPKSWVIEGSRDGCAWDVVDEETNCPLLNGAACVHTFRVEGARSAAYRYVRMRQTGPNWVGQNYLKIEAIEFYGTLI